MKRKKFSSNLQENVPKRTKNDDSNLLFKFYQDICEIFNIKFESKMSEAIGQYARLSFTENKESNLINLLK